MSAVVTIVAGPVLAQDGKGRPKWGWTVERTVSGITHKREEANVAGTKATFRAAILGALGEGHPVHARFIDQTGGGEEVKYGADGRIQYHRRIDPTEGLIGPRCFVAPIGAADRKARTAVLRPPKKAPAPKAEKPAKPSKPAKPPKAEKPAKPPREPKPPKAERPPKAPKPPREPKPPKVPGMSPYVRAYLALTTDEERAAWAGRAAPYEIAQVVRYVEQHGSAADKAGLAVARAEARMIKDAAKPPKAPRQPKAQPPKTPMSDPIRVPSPGRPNRQQIRRPPTTVSDPVFVPLYEPSAPAEPRFPDVEVIHVRDPEPPAPVAPPPPPTPPAAPPAMDPQAAAWMAALTAMLEG